jgi:hypothetical protein
VLGLHVERADARRAGGHDHGAADHDRVCAELRALLGVEQERLGDELRDHRAAGLGERRRHDHRAPLAERAQGQIQVVEARVHQLDRARSRAGEPRELGVGLLARPGPPAADEPPAEGKRVARALLDRAVGERRHAVAVVREPRLEVRALVAPLRVQHPGGDERVADHEAGVRGEDHVGEVGPRVDRAHVGPGAAERRDQLVPLRAGARAVHRYREVHPRVDRVRQLEVVGRAHEVAAAPAERRGGDVVDRCLEHGLPFGFETVEPISAAAQA